MRAVGTVFVVVCEPDRVSNSGEPWFSVHHSIDGAGQQILKEIASWADGNWDDYSLQAVRDLRQAVENDYHDQILELWNSMSSLQITIEERGIQDDDDREIDFQWPEEDDE